MKIRKLTIRILIGCVFLSCFSAAFAQDKPNIVLVFMDNFGWGEPGFNGGGIIRGAATPRLDSLAADGLRLTNFNVEAQCTPSRAAIMSGRYAIRGGNGTIPLGGGVYGLVQWEITMAEMLADAGYATGMFGKWHLGHTEGRFPTDQGFDEWYGIPNSSDEAAWESQTIRSSSLPRITGQKRYLRVRTPPPLITPSRERRVPGVEPCLPASRAACACRSPSVGRARFPPEASATRSCTRWISFPLLRG
jgi:hypothetical protein